MFFAEFVDHVGNFVFRPMIDNVSRCKRLAEIKAHVQGAFPHKRKPPFGGLKLKTAETQIQQNAIDRHKVLRSGDLGQLVEKCLNDGE